MEFSPNRLCEKFNQFHYQSVSFEFCRIVKYPKVKNNLEW